MAITHSTHVNYTLDEVINNFWELIDGTFQTFADKKFIVTPRGQITYGDTGRLSNALSAELAHKIPQPGVGVGLFLKDPLKIVPSLAGILKAGHYFVPLDVSFPEATLKSIIETANIRILVTDEDNISKITGFVDSKIILVNFDHLDGDSTQSVTPYKFQLDDRVQIQFTSGSTGTPKGAIKTFRTLTHSLCTRFKNTPFMADDRSLELSSFSFSAMNSLALSALFIGMTLYCSDPKEDGLGHLSEWITNEKLTRYNSTVTVFRTWAGTLSSDQRFPTILSANAGAEKKTSQDLELMKILFPNLQHFRLGFASTEAQSVTSCSLPVDYQFEGSDIPCGWPNDGMTVMIWDANGNSLPDGEEGEIVVYSKYLSRGYVNNPELTQEKFIPDSRDSLFQYYKTGDLGKIRSDGQLVHLGRIDNMVKIKGVRIELNSLEKHMLAYPGVLQTAFNLFDDKKGNKKLAAYFIAEPDIQIPISDLRKSLLERLPTHQLPHYFIQMDEFPLGRTGKLDKKQLPRPAMTRPPLSHPYIAPANEMESTLVRIWEEEIGVDGIGVTDDFFEVGGDSLIGVILFIRIEKELGRNLPVSTLLSASTIRSQAEVINQADWEGDFLPVITIRANGANTPLFFIPGKGGFPTRIHHLAKLLDNDTPIYALQDLLEHGNGKRAPSIKSTASFYINEMKKVVPHGPYILLGESMGGLIAMEIAQGLTENDETVPFIALLDTYNMDGFEVRKSRIKFYWSLFNKHLRILFTSNWAGKFDYLRFYRQSAIKRLNAIKKRRRQRSKERLDQLKSLQGREQQNLNAAKQYHPRPYPGKVVCFKAIRGVYKEEWANGWDKVQLGELIVQPLDCYHGSILFEPAVSKLAKDLNEHLRQYNTQGHS